MAKKKTNIDDISDNQFVPETTTESAIDKERHAIDIVSVTPACPTPAQPIQPTAQPAKKKRIRIRKKATRKLSAAIICQNPNITQFI
jgi:hypothetical protein